MGPSRFRGCFVGRWRALAAGLALVNLVAAAARAEGAGMSGSTPLAVDFKRAPVGSWADYRIQVGGGAPATMKTRWAFLGRDAEGNTLELTMEGAAVPTSTRDRQP